MMKRLLAIGVVMTFLFTGLTAYAKKTQTNTTGTAAITTTGTTAAATGTTATKATSEIAKSDAAKAFQNGVKALKTQLDTIRTNNEELNKLQAESKAELNRIQKLIREAIKNVGTLSEDKILKIKTILSTISQDQTLLTSTAGKIAEQNKILNAAKKDKNLEAYKAAIASIIVVQNDRKTALTKIVADMKAVTAI